MVLTEFWIVTGCLVAWRSGALPRSLCALDTAALVYPLGTAGSQTTGGVGSGLWDLGIASLINGLPIWFLASGVWALVTGTRTRPPNGQAASA